MLCSTDADNCNGSNVKVVVRIRPQNEREKDERCVVNAVSNQVLVFDPAEDVCEFNGQKSSAIVRGDITRRRFKNLNFAFDYVFGPDSMNVDLYEHTSKSILDGLLNGYNCSGETFFTVSVIIFPEQKESITSNNNYKVVYS